MEPIFKDTRDYNHKSDRIPFRKTILHIFNRLYLLGLINYQTLGEKGMVKSWVKLTHFTAVNLPK